ncbi:DNA adenine methylase [Paracoccaceae bacterium Fryx2]|nr:DNA adenine methylase [Paracoccaceae bacterium Fryx2]
MTLHPLSTPVEPVLPVAPWLGGKRNLAKRICAQLDAIPCTTYAEPFVGMGGIFLRRSARPRAEVIDDRGRDVANLFRILQRHYPQFLDTLRFQLTTRVEFNRLVDTNPETLTDLERAARFLYLQRTAFGGKISGRNFGVAKDRPGRFNLTTLEPMLEDLHSRLSGVVIECLDWSDFIRRYDGPGTLFFLDPPYWGCETDYGKAMFARDDFARMSWGGSATGPSSVSTSGAGKRVACGASGPCGRISVRRSTPPARVMSEPSQSQATAARGRVALASAARCASSRRRSACGRNAVGSPTLLPSGSTTT